MMNRQPETREYAGGMPPGIDNPLGARALYIYRNGRDTFYRLHGTHEVWSERQSSYAPSPELPTFPRI
jgi:lipoprotein-anchoring transpeptidase ErfK/SrfK